MNSELIQSLCLPFQGACLPPVQYNCDRKPAFEMDVRQESSKDIGDCIGFSVELFCYCLKTYLNKSPKIINSLL